MRAAENIFTESTPAGEHIQKMLPKNVSARTQGAYCIINKDMLFVLHGRLFISLEKSFSITHT